MVGTITQMHPTAPRTCLRDAIAASSRWAAASHSAARSCCAATNDSYSPRSRSPSASSC